VAQDALPSEGAMGTLRPWQLVQAAKAVCTFLGSLETLDTQEACDSLIAACRAADSGA